MLSILSGEQQEFARRFDEFCRVWVAPYASLHDRDGRVAPEVWRALQRFGYFKLFHRREHGGAEAEPMIMALAIEILARYCASSAYSANVSTTLYGKVAAEHLRPEQRKRWLTPVLEGEQVGCFMVTEPHHPAGDFEALTATITRKGERYLLNGVKSQVGNGPIADVGLVYCLLEEEPGRREQAFALVDFARAGVRVRHQPRQLALRAMPWAEVRFVDYAVELDEILVSGRNSPGFSVWSAMKAVDWGKILVYLASLGAARSALTDAVSYVAERQCFGRAFKHLQGVQATLSRMQWLLDAAEVTAYRAIEVKASGAATEPALSGAKVFVTEASAEITRLGLSLYGGYGVNAAELPNLPMARYFRDAMAGIHAGITSNMALDLLVCASLGENGFKGDDSDWIRDAGLI